MIWVFLAFTAASTVVAAVAYAPLRKEPFSVVSFAVTFVAGELPLHAAAAVVAGTVVLGSVSHPRGWVWWLAGSLGAVAVLAYVALGVVAHRSGRVVDEALETASGGPVRPEGVDPAPVWATWWRVVLAVPFRTGGIRRVRNVDYAGDGRHRHMLDVLVRRDDPPSGAPVLVYVHGGAWIIGDKREQGLPMLYELARRGWVCVTINYRTSPQATWPDHIVDCKRALAWVRSHIGEYGGDPSFLAVSGGSAGGHLCALAALTPDVPEWQPGFEEADTSVDACVPFYGVHDMTGAPEAQGSYGHGLVELLEKRVMKVPYVENTPLYAAASPDQRVTASAPPFLVVQGANDTLVPPQVARRFVERLREGSRAPVAYLELPVAQHAFDILVSIRSRRTTLGVVRFLEGMRARAPGTSPGRAESPAPRHAATRVGGRQEAPMDPAGTLDKGRSF